MSDDPLKNKDFLHGTLNGYRYRKCRCDACKRASTEAHARWALKNKERLREYQATRYAENPNATLDYNRAFRQKLRKEVLDHYGGKCACCGESELPFLSLDHKNGGGSKHRKELGLRGSGIWAWVKREGFPDLFQVLCHNCNQAKGYYGTCPHEARRAFVKESPHLRLVSSGS